MLPLVHRGRREFAASFSGVAKIQLEEAKPVADRRAEWIEERSRLQLATASSGAGKLAKQRLNFTTSGS